MSLATASPEPKRNGAKLASIEVARRDTGATYHGVPVLELHAGDALPTPRAPQRWAVKVTPDLARYLLTFNHAQNRHLRERRIREYAATMRDDLWEFTPESVVFSQTSVLQNGQNRLMAVTEVGKAVWLMLDFGWPDGIINAMDRGISKTNADAFHVNETPNANALAAAISHWHKYQVVRSVDPARSFNALEPLGTPRTVATYESDPDGWNHSVLFGRRVYKALDLGASAAIWGAAHRIVTEARGREMADAYFAAIYDGTGDPRSASRTIRDWYVRRPVTATRTGDAREPLENIIRGFNAWRAGKSVSLVTRPGFELSPVR